MVDFEDNPQAHELDPNDESMDISEDYVTYADVDRIADRVDPVPEQVIPKACKVRPGSGALYKREFRALSRLKESEAAMLPVVIRTCTPEREPPLSYHAKREKIDRSYVGLPGNFHRKLHASNPVPAVGSSRASPLKQKRNPTRPVSRPPSQPPSRPISRGQLGMSLGSRPVSGRSSWGGDDASSAGGTAQRMYSLAHSSAIALEGTPGGKPTSPDSPLTPVFHSTKASVPRFLKKCKSHMRSFDYSEQQSAAGLRSSLYARKQETKASYDSRHVTMCERIGKNYSLYAFGLSARTLQLPIEERPPHDPPPAVRMEDLMVTEDSPEIDLLKLELEGGAEADADMKDITEMAKNMISFLPLEVFDEEESRYTPEQWVALKEQCGGAENTVGYTPYFNIQSGEYEYTPCHVLSYSLDERAFEVEIQKDGRIKNVKRLNLRFHLENERDFKIRVASAKRKREEAEAHLRLHHYIESLSHDDIIINFDHGEILQRAGTSFRQESVFAIHEALSAEVTDMYLHALKKGILQYRRLNPAEERRVQPLHFPSNPRPPRPKEKGKVQLFVVRPGDDELPMPAIGKWMLPSFLDTVDWAKGNLYIVKPQLQTVLCAVELCTMSVDNRLLFRKGNRYEWPFKLEDFKSMQQNHLEHLKDDINQLVMEMEMELPQDGSMLGVGGGGTSPVADFPELMSQPAGGNMTRLVRQVELKTADALHCLVIRSAEEYLKFLSNFEPAARQVSTISRSSTMVRKFDSMAPVETAQTTKKPKVVALHPPPPSAEIDKEMEHFQGALVSVQLWMDVTPEKKEITFVPTLTDIQDMLCGTFSDMVNVAAEFPNLFQELVGLPHRPFNEQGWGDDARVLAARQEVTALVERVVGTLMRLAELYQEHLPEIFTDQEALLGELANENTPLSLYSKHIDTLTEAANAVLATSRPEEYTGIVMVSCQELRTALRTHAENTIQMILDQLLQKVNKLNNEICDSYGSMSDQMMSIPNDVEGVLELQRFIAESTEERERLEKCIEDNKIRIDFLFGYRYEIPEEAYDLAMQAFVWPKKMVEIANNSQSMAAAEKSRLEQRLRQSTVTLQQTLQESANQVEEFKSVTCVMLPDGMLDPEMLTENAEKVATINAKLNAMREEAEDINREENLLGWKKTSFPALEAVVKEFEPYSTIWHITNEFSMAREEWMNGPFRSLDSEAMDGFVTEWYRKAFKLTKTFANSPDLLKIATWTKDQVSELRKAMPLVIAVTNPGLRGRHWAQMSDIIGFKFSTSDNANLRMLLDMKAVDHQAALEEVSECASREHALERTLDKMQGDWQGMMFELMPWKETGSYILKGASVDEAQALLDDHIIKTQAMRSSPFAAPFYDRIVNWEAKLGTMQEIIDKWLVCQSKWIYLEPVFGSEEIYKQMPKEGAAFAACNKFWRGLMAKVSENCEILLVTEIENLIESLTNSNSSLSAIEKKLNDYLDTKKMACPRFWFLSNEELLEILSETKDPHNVQPFVKKLIEAIGTLEFNEDNNISAMNSVEGERVGFKSFVNPNVDGKGVEVWMVEVEDVMRASLHEETHRALEAFPTKKRSEWLLDWPGQIVISVSQMFWTKDVATAIRGHGAQGLLRYAKACSEELVQTVTLVRGNLTKLERATIGALVVVDVHARDVVQSMGEEDVNDDTDFKWLSQLRYYWEEEEVVVKMINAIAYYGYEYLGNSSRLVITPLTDRCYRTLLGAIHLCLGGAPAGPAGTGKTETTKDLSKAIAIQCVVFNCSDGLDYVAMGKFFKGLASSGAWACFDEFNRIELEVLSVVAQQVLTIQRAIALKKTRFMFEGVEMQLRSTCNVFITMNPGYAGRSELPDNLKALFRDVAMMVPDYALISEIILYSFGYLEARLMGQKLVQTYRLCSEQLSKQDHYDYGMRAVMAVLRAAGNLKQKFKEEREDVLMLRAIGDVNEPKFLDEDVPLFKGILSDLFPGVVLPEADYVNMLNALKERAASRNLQPLSGFFNKIIQLYEMIVVRHGLMLVGESFGMKTCQLRVLQEALSDLCKAGLNDEQNTKIFALNPKSITMGQLYGQDDPVSKEWTDGVLAVLFRGAARDTSPDRKWVVFDGPVDAIWIENMNTVLDDNKKLCLNSGEIVAMQGLMNMIFEVQDLAVASPATVSRCGMVYVQALLLGWRPTVVSWMNTLPDAFPEEQKEMLMALFDWLVPICLRVALKECVSPVPMQDINLVQSLCRMIDSMIVPEFKDKAWIEKQGEKGVTVRLECIFLFSLVWSIGGNTDENGRQKFDSHLRRFLHDDVDASLKPYMEGEYRKLAQPFPNGALVYGFMFNKAKGVWTEWLDTVDPQVIPNTMEFTQITVTTVDTIRYNFLVSTLMESEKHLLLVGPTGTGKTLYVKNHLMTGVDKAKWEYMAFTFSAQTSVNMTQDIIDGKLDKRRKGVFGPRPGKRCAIFVDDLNMPAVEEYGAQPPIELLRQFMDHDGWYDRKELSFRRLVDIQFIAAMGPPGGGRSHVTNRYMRHFSVVAVTEFDNQTLTRVFTKLVNWWFTRCQYGEEITKYEAALVKASLDIYATAQRELLPTPLKSHYTFNLRDLSKVFQGIQSAATTVDDPGELMRLWTHEILRVFHDRLVEDADREWIVQVLKKKTELHFQENFYKLMSRFDDDGDQNITGEELRHLMFGDFMIPGADPALYDEITDEDELFKVVTGYLDDYNSMSKKPMPLVLFLFAIEHVSRICRIIKQPGGHALLVGVGGSGRQSLTRLATFMEEFELYQVEITKTYGTNEWKDDLKKTLRLAGETNKTTVFMFNDTQIQWEGMVEDISNLLNTGEVPNLFDGSDMATIGENIRPRAKAAKMDGTKADIYNFFIQEVRKNLHVVLCFSPVGEAFRTRLRKFPSLVTCTTIDWFSAWPEDALHAVADSFLNEIEELAANDMKEPLTNMCVFFHSSAQDLATRYQTEARRYFYVTPTSYLELLSSFKVLLAKRYNEVATVRKRYQVGLEKLLDTEAQVKVMQAELTELQPKLQQSTRETEDLMQVIEKESVEADKVKSVVSKEEAIANAEASKVKAIKDDCEGDLSKAMPLLEAALKALDTLKPADITEVKGMKSPPAPVKLVMEAVCIMKGLKAARVKDKSGHMVDDFWETSKKMVSDVNFLKGLRDYDKDNIDPKIIVKIKTYIDNPMFEPETIKKASNAAFGLCCWVRAMESYDTVAKVVKPKKIALAAAEVDLAKVMAELKIKQDELQTVVDRLNALDAELRAAKDKKDKLSADVQDCEQKLDRAQKLITGLGGEKTRWTAQAEMLGQQLEMLTGDVLLSVGVIAYLGPFTANYRSDIVKQWVDKCNEMGIPCNSGFSLINVVGDPVKIRAWNIHGLPKDDFSVENGIIIDQGRRWPLCIDPQGQTNKWIRNLESSRELRAVKLSDDDLLRNLETAITYGKPVLLENVGESLDASLEPVLMKQTFKQGSRYCIKLGDSVMEWSNEFTLYITTKLRNPHYPPELCTKVSLLNFMITPDGLEDQLLGIVVATERPDLEEEKNQLIIQGAENKRQLKEIEDKILEVLSKSEGNILDDATAVQILSEAKIVSDDISKKQVVAEATEKKIDEARVGYKPVAKHASIVFFAVADMANIDPMYQYSLTWFIALFIRGIHDSPKSDNLIERLKKLNEFFTYFLFRQVCQSLFEKDKMLFAFLLASKLLLGQSEAVEGQMTAGELRFLLTGGLATGENPHPNPSKDWLSDKAWGEICRLDQLSEEFDGLRQHVVSHLVDWWKLYNSTNPQDDPLPEPWQENLNAFQRILVLRTLRADKLVPIIQRYVIQILGERYVAPQPFNLAPIYKESSASVPLIFVLSAGSDPFSSLLTFADTLGRRVESVSLGQGQGPVAQKWIDEGVQAGFWVVLMNCHLATSFLGTLEVICEKQLTAPSTHNDFRLWLTSYPSPIFPISILENGVKVTNEPPKGLRAGLLRLYESDPISDQKFFNGCGKVDEWRKMLFALSTFHCVIRQRRAFGPIGWNIPYEFNENDMKISVRQLQMFIDEYDEVPFPTLSYTCGECNYGGKVTDAKDRRLLTTMLDNFYTPAALEDNYKMSPGGIYYIPPKCEFQEYITYVQSLPLIAPPEMFGLHDNANINKEMQETAMLLNSLMLTQSRDASAGGSSVEQIIASTSEDILNRLPPNFNLELAIAKYPVTYLDSMNTVLTQELGRVNGLTSVIRKSLVDIGKAVKGLVVMSADLEKIGQALGDGRVPAAWLKKSFASLKPLGPYMKEVLERITFFGNWLNDGPPTVFWFSGFFFTQAFMTGARQNYARKYKVAIDQIDFDFEVKDGDNDCDIAPEDGAYVDGIFIEGCRWDPLLHVLNESEPKVLFTSFPTIWLKPEKIDAFSDFPSYNCPVYKTSERRGVLSTTGHSTNFVMDIRVPSDKPQAHWIKRGVAMLTSLDD